MAIMRAASPGRVAAQGMDTNHGRRYIVMAKKCLDSGDIVAPSSGCVAEKWPLWVKTRRHRPA
jgi:hypothetical protein